MKRLLVLLIFLIFMQVCVFARIGVELGPFAEAYTLREPYSWKYRPIPVFGASMYLQTGKLCTLNYSCGFSMYNHDKHCVRSSLGAIVGAAIAHNSSESWAALFLALLPKGIGLYTREDHKGFHVSLDLLPCDYFYRGTLGSHERWVYSFGTTVRYRQLVGDRNFAVVPYVEFIVTKPISFSIGCQLMFESAHRDQSSTDRDRKNMELPSGNRYH